MIHELDNYAHAHTKKVDQGGKQRILVGPRLIHLVAYGLGINIVTTT